MFGLIVFSSVVMNVGERCRNRILGNIFEVDNVSVSDVSLREGQVIFRLFSEGVFYQFVYVESRNGDVYFKVASTRDIVNQIVSISDEVAKKENYEALIMKFICCYDELELYRRMRLFL